MPKFDSKNFDLNAKWRSKPRGRRLFTEEEIRRIRQSPISARMLSVEFDCSHVLIYYIKKRAIYSDIN